MALSVWELNYMLWIWEIHKYTGFKGIHVDHNCLFLISHYRLRGNHGSSENESTLWNSVILQKEPSR